MLIQNMMQEFYVCKVTVIEADQKLSLKLLYRIREENALVGFGPGILVGAFSLQVSPSPLPMGESEWSNQWEWAVPTALGCMFHCINLPPPGDLGFGTPGHWCEDEIPSMEYKEGRERTMDGLPLSRE